MSGFERVQKVVFLGKPKLSQLLGLLLVLCKMVKCSEL
jgi:hypothetical protein